VTYALTASLTQQGDINLNASYLVALSGGAWNKTLSMSSQASTQTGTSSATLSKGFFFNVSQVVSLAKEIGAELQYSSPSYRIQIEPVVTGTLTEAGRTVPLHFATPMNLTFTNGVITPSGTAYSYQGNITSEAIVGYGSTTTYRFASYGLLSSSLVILGLVVYYVLRVEKKDETAKEDDIAEKTRPYREVIASTTSLPMGGAQIPMEKWEDLLKVADALGKPILEFVDEGEGFTHSLFWVLDGQTTYIYEVTTKQNWAR